MAAEWEVPLTISGAITIKQPITLDVIKGRYQSFWTTVKISKAPRNQSGVIIVVVARADDQEEANEAGIFFVGQMLDVLCLRINLPMSVNLSTGIQIQDTYPPFSRYREIRNSPQDGQNIQRQMVNAGTRRFIEDTEWDEAFTLGRDYGIGRPVFSRAISWYRKGMTSEDPIDKFIAFWSSLEGVGSSFARRNDRTAKGSINQICDCFEQLWGDNPKKWPIISSNVKWINKFHEKRNGIAHGYIPVNVETLREISSQLPQVQKLAYRFLSDCERNGAFREQNA